jgi:hypothetical protein
LPEEVSGIFVIKVNNDTILALVAELHLPSPISDIEMEYVS